MDLLAIVRSLRRHLRITLSVLAVTVVAIGWLVVFMPRTYEAQSEFVLVNPAPPPTDAQIEKDPSLGGVNRNNPYLRFANEGTVGHVLSGRMSGDTVREAIAAQGGDSDYSVEPSPTSGQIIDVVGSGTSAQQAETTLRLVSTRMQTELEAMQRVYGAQDLALITALPVADPTGAHVKFSGTIRMLVGVLGAGVIALFAAISIAEARAAGSRDVAPTGFDGPPSGPGGGRRPVRREQGPQPQYGPTGPPAPPQQPQRPSVGVPALAQQHGRRPTGRPVRAPGERFDDVSETVALPMQPGLAANEQAAVAPQAPQTAAPETVAMTTVPPVPVVPEPPAAPVQAAPVQAAPAEPPAPAKSAPEQTVFLRVASEPVEQNADETSIRAVAPVAPTAVGPVPDDAGIESPPVPQAAPEAAAAPAETDAAAGAGGETTPARPAPRRRPSPSGLRPPAAMAPAPPVEPASEAG